MPLNASDTDLVRIFIVEDEAIIARDIALQIADLGYQSAGIATTAEEAIVKCGQALPDLVLMDIQLAGAMDGIEAAQIIRNQFGIPVILLTAYASDDYILRAKVVEPFGYILKPFSPAEVRIALEMALYKHQTEVQLRIGNAALHAISQGVLITDNAHRVQLVNAAFSQITGFNEADLKRPIWQVLAASCVDSTVLQSLRESCIAQNTFNGELFCQHKDGRHYWNALTFTPIRDVRGNVTHSIYKVRDITGHKQALEQLRELSLHQMHIKEDEQKQIAREIHDDLGSLLYGIQSCLATVINQSKSDVAPALLQAQEMSGRALDTMRNIIVNLRPSVLDQLGVWAALEWYSQQLEKRTHLRCDCSIDETLAEMEVATDASTAIFRIVQELLQNVLRHADASVVQLRVTQEDKLISIEVADNGIGIDDAELLSEKAWGIIGMYERASPFQGKLKIMRQVQGGTLARLQFPWELIHA